MASNEVNYLGNLVASSIRESSPAIWGNCPVSEFNENPGKGIHFYDDFTDLPLAGTQTTQIGYGKYKVFATTGSSVSRISTVNSVEIMGGCLKLATDTDDDSASLAQAYPGFSLSGSRTTSGKLWFECCIAQKSVATNMAATFVGLAETEQWTLATGVPFNAGDAITNGASAIGFRIEEDGLGVIDTVVSDRATSFTNIGDTEGGTLVAYTFKKLGFVYDLDLPAAERITFYTNGIACATKYTQTQLAATTNLDSNALGLIIATCADSAGTAHELYMKWWRIAQRFPGY